MSPRPYRPDGQTWEVVPGNAHLHLAEHLGYLALERGDMRAAEEAARWGHDLDVGAFPDPRSSAYTHYNLGCYYARNRRSGEAAPWFEKAFGLKPDLKAWAAKDTDLDAVRTHAQISRLLA